MTYEEFVKPNGEYKVERDVLANVSLGGDEYYTLPEHVMDIIENLNVKPRDVIWCPFDEEWSQFPILLKEYGYNVVRTSTDFFTTEPPENCSVVISNPPFSRKKEILQRLSELNLKFVLILPGLWLNDGIPFDYGHQVMMWRKRVHFRTPDGEKNKPRTTCFVLSNGALVKDFKIINDKKREYK